MDEILHGEMAMFMWHMVLTSGEDQVPGLLKDPEALLTKAYGRTSGQYILQMGDAARICGR